MRSNGNPTFFLANVVDDEAMGITHVIRGEDHVNGTPKYLLLRGALGFGDATRLRASCPCWSTSSARSCRSGGRGHGVGGVVQGAGFLPEAMRNYLSLLGWGPADGVEVRPVDEIVDLFRLEDVNPSPGVLRSARSSSTSTASGSGGSTSTTSSSGRSSS